MTNALLAASYIEDHLDDDRVDGMRLQKLLYFAQAWSLAWSGRELFEAEFQAWRDGPVNREVYDAFGRREIDAYEGGLDEESTAVLDAVIEYYGHMTGGELSHVTHEEDPWVNARAGLTPHMGSQRPIPTSTIRDYYARKAISGAPGPVRRRSDRNPEAGRALRVARGSMDRWRGTLEILADR